MEEPVQQPPQFRDPEGDVWIHTRIMLEQLEPKQCLPRVAWGVLLHDVRQRGRRHLDPRRRLETGIRFDRHAEIGARSWPRRSAAALAFFCCGYRTD